MNDRLNLFTERIDKLTPLHSPKYGKMNVHQMVCHCTDFYRLVLGEKTLEDRPTLSAKEVFILAKEKKTVPAPKGMDQVLGKGTPPSTFKNDIALLKEKLSTFLNLDHEHDFPPHFYFGKLDPQKWIEVSDYHLNHHLKQFGV